MSTSVNKSICRCTLIIFSKPYIGAEKVLNKVEDEKLVLGMWRYKEKHHYDLVKAVCVQIKGEIQATLG